MKGRRCFLGFHSLSLEGETSTRALANFSLELAKFSREFANFKRNSSNLSKSYTALTNFTQEIARINLQF